METLSIKLLRRYAQGSENALIKSCRGTCYSQTFLKSLKRWSQEVSTAAQLISYEEYNWKQATVDAILLQTSSPKLRERALQEDTYDALMTIMSVAKEQSAKGAALLEQASGKTSYPRVKAEVRKLQQENQ